LCEIWILYKVLEIMDIKAINGVLEKNSEKNFVQRIINPDIFPVLPNPDGSFSTHSMAYGEADGKYYVYPTVQYDPAHGLRRFDPKSAFLRALNNKEYITFKNEKDAAEFSKEYKKVWKTGK